MERRVVNTAELEGSVLEELLRAPPRKEEPETDTQTHNSDTNEIPCRSTTLTDS